MMHTVLLVEDEADLRDLIKEALEMSGYEVVSAADGREALEAIPGIEHLCLVLLDLLMPRMNGWEFLEHLRTQRELDDVPVVVHSSAPQGALARAARILQKPVKLEQLLAVVGEYCTLAPLPT